MPDQTHHRIRIVTDSAACVPREQAEAYGIVVVPYYLIWDGQAYADGRDLSAAEFYRRFREARTYPTTAQPPLGEFLEVYQKLGEDCDGIVSIHVAERLTSAIRVSRQAARELSDLPIRVVDTHTAASPEAFVVLAAARAAARGALLEEVVAVAEACRERVGMYFAMQTLEHLRRGGRIGQAATLLGARLRIQPVLTVRDGEVQPIRVTRDWQRALQQVVDQTSNKVGSSPVHLAAFHADMPADANALLEQAQQRMNVLDSYVAEFTPVMGAHTGPGIVGLGYCLEQSDTTSQPKQH